MPKTRITLPEVPLTVHPRGRLPYRVEIPKLADQGCCPCALGVFGPCDVAFNEYGTNCQTSNHGVRMAWMLATPYMAG